MKNILYFITLLTLLSCTNRNKEIKVNGFNEEWQAHIDSVSSTFTDKEDPYGSIKIDTLTIDSLRISQSSGAEKNLFLNLKSGITQKQYDKLYNTLIKNGTLKVFNNKGDYYYNLHIEDGKSVDIQITPTFINNKLYKLELLCWGMERSSEHDMINYYISELGTPYLYRYNHYWFNNGIEIKVSEKLIQTDPNLSPILMGVVYISDLFYNINKE